MSLHDFLKNPDEILATAKAQAQVLLSDHIEKAHDLNPYSTAGARAEFQRGFYDTAVRSWENPDRSLDYRFQLGRAVAVLCKAKGL
jgi:hypothetical protein